MKPLRPAFIMMLWVVLGAAGAALGQQAPKPAFKLIVHSSNPATNLERQLVIDVFLKRATRWPNGEIIRVADLLPDSPTRKMFSQDVMGRSVAAVQSFWQQLIFSGRDVPPPELADDAEVIKYVSKYPGGIGYVSTSADVGRVKVVELR